jgi:hypothetical protein
MHNKKIAIRNILIVCIAIGILFGFGKSTKVLMRQLVHNFTNVLLKTEEAINVFSPSNQLQIED